MTYHDGSKWTGGDFSAPFDLRSNRRRIRSRRVLSEDESAKVLAEAALINEHPERSIVNIFRSVKQPECGGRHLPNIVCDECEWLRKILSLCAAKEALGVDAGQLVRLGDCVAHFQETFEFGGGVVKYPDYLFDVSGIIWDILRYPRKKFYPAPILRDLMDGYEFGYASEYRLSIARDYSPSYRFGYWVGYYDSPGPKVRPNDSSIIGHSDIGHILAACIIVLMLFIWALAAGLLARLPV